MPTDTTRRKRPSMVAMTAKVTAIAVAAAIAITGGLAIQMAAGHDPALAAKAKHQASATGTSARHLLNQQLRRRSDQRGSPGAGGDSHVVTSELDRRIDLFGTEVRILVARRRLAVLRGTRSPPSPSSDCFAATTRS